MGHVPSKDFCQEPFVMDLFSKTGTERLVAINLCKENFPSRCHPLFQKACEVRAENHVRNWHWRPTGLPFDTLPPVPSDEILYEYYVEDSTAVLNMNLPPSQWIPMPCMFVKMNEATCVELPTADNCEVVGIVGSRQFELRASEDGEHKVNFLREQGLCYTMLTHSFYNEIKAIACFQMLCACYRHFCLRAGLGFTAWPRGTGSETAVSNLPFVKLAYQMNAFLAASGAESGIAVEKDGRLYVGCQQPVLSACAEACAQHVTYMPIPSGLPQYQNSSRPILKPEHSLKVRSHGAYPPPPPTPKLQLLNDLVDRAKPKWRTANQAVTKELQRIKEEEATTARPTTTPSHPLSCTPTSSGSSCSSGSETGLSDESMRGSASSGSAHAASQPSIDSAVSVNLPLSDTLDALSLEERSVRHRRRSILDVFHFTPSRLGEKSQLPPSPTPVQVNTMLHTTGHLQPQLSHKIQNHSGPAFPDSFLKTNTPPPSVVLSSPQAIRGHHSEGRNGFHHIPSLSPPAASSVDLRVFIGDGTPVTIRTPEGEWVRKYWRSPLQPLVRCSTWQPHLEHGWVAYAVEHSSLSVYDTAWQPELLVDCSLYLFLVVGEATFTVSADGRDYFPRRAA